MERCHLRRGSHDVWLTFWAEDRPGPAAAFGVLVGLEEVRLLPRAGPADHPRDEAETITYVFRGALAQRDSTGRSGVIQAGEFQRITTGRGIRRKESNASRIDWTHLFRVSFLPAEVGAGPSYEQKRFAAAERHNVLCVVASPDGRQGSLRIHQDAFVYSGALDPGRHLVHELRPDRGAWLHVISGEAALQDVVMTAGDGAGVTGESSVSLTAREETEILFLDLCPEGRSL